MWRMTNRGLSAFGQTWQIPQMPAPNISITPTTKPHQSHKKKKKNHKKEIAKPPPNQSVQKTTPPTQTCVIVFIVVSNGWAVIPRPVCKPHHPLRPPASPRLRKKNLWPQVAPYIPLIGAKLLSPPPPPGGPRSGAGWAMQPHVTCRAKCRTMSST